MNTYNNLMTLKERIDFIGLTEPDVNSLKMFFNRCKTSNIPETLAIGEIVIENTYAIEDNKELPTIQLDFENYISYSITNESYTSWDDYEMFEGKYFRTYTKSRYLDFISFHTFASEDYPGPFVHYCITCLNHIVNIVSVDPPKVCLVER